MTSRPVVHGTPPPVAPGWQDAFTCALVKPPLREAMHCGDARDLARGLADHGHDPVHASLLVSLDQGMVAHFLEILKKKHHHHARIVMPVTVDVLHDVCGDAGAVTFLWDHAPVRAAPSKDLRTAYVEAVATVHDDLAARPAGLPAWAPELTQHEATLGRLRASDRASAPAAPVGVFGGDDRDPRPERVTVAHGTTVTAYAHDVVSLLQDWRRPEHQRPQETHVLTRPGSDGTPYVARVGTTTADLLARCTSSARVRNLLDSLPEGRQSGALLLISSCLREGVLVGVPEEVR